MVFGRRTLKILLLTPLFFALLFTPVLLVLLLPPVRVVLECVLVLLILLLGFLRAARTSQVTKSDRPVVRP